jgi:para-aminobenzoate synthetase / 4-amino-4-deoxychorismate lyase
MAPDSSFGVKAPADVVSGSRGKDIVAMSQARGWHNAGVHSTSRPDPKKGIFETLLVVDGRPIELDAHLDRLATSIATLYGPAAATDPGEAIVERAHGIELGRLRATLVPSADGPMTIEIVTAEVEPALVFPGPERAVSAHTLLLEGGLGAHKWVDRDLIGETEARLAADAVPLLVDHGGAVLEASRANVFAVYGDRLATPPADGRILPGIARRRVAGAAAAAGLLPEETELTIGDLMAADEVFLAGSVRGVEPVRAVDGVRLSTRNDAGGRIAAELKRAWMPSPAGVPSSPH